MNNKILVSGAAGFIGSHLVELLIKAGYNVKAFVRYNSKNNWGWLENSKYKNDIEFFQGDIRDFDAVNSALHGCNSVFHLAALIGIPYSYISPLAYIRTNIEGTYNVLESSKQNNIENIIVTSTSETYGSAQYTPMDENHPLVGQSPYSSTKISSDTLALSYHKSFKLPVKVVRPFNTYGPRQSARAIIPTVISQILNNEKTIELGSLKPKRDFTFVKDTVSGFFEISKKRSLEGTVTNIGMNSEVTMGDLVKKISHLMGKKINIKSDQDRVRPKSSEVDRLICDNTKIKSVTNWEPQYSLEEGLSKTIQWFINNIKDYKHKIYNV